MDLFVGPEYPETDGADTLKKGQVTGVFISPRHILTSAHIIFDGIDNDNTRCPVKARSITVSPGPKAYRPLNFRRDGTLDPIGTTLGAIKRWFQGMIK